MLILAFAHFFSITTVFNNHILCPLRKIKNIKLVIRSCKWKEDRKYNGQSKGKRTDITMVKVKEGGQTIQWSK